VQGCLSEWRGRPQHSTESALSAEEAAAIRARCASMQMLGSLCLSSMFSAFNASSLVHPEAKDSLVLLV
jgi:hypothetical protein